MLSTVFLVCCSKQDSGDSPHGCSNDGFEFDENLVRLNINHADRPVIYMFQNKSDHVLILNHESKEGAAHAGWGSQLGQQNWSSFMVARRKFPLTCYKYNENAQLEIVNCKDVLTICQIVDFIDSSQHMRGTFWIAEDMPLRAVKIRMKNRGISVP